MLGAKDLAPRQDMYFYWVASKITPGREGANDAEQQTSQQVHKKHETNYRSLLKIHTESMKKLVQIPIATNKLRKRDTILIPGILSSIYTILYSRKTA